MIETNVTPDQAMASFVIIKPDAIERGYIGRIITRIEDVGFRLSGMQQRRKSEEWCRAHYSNVDNEEVMQALVGFMSAVPILGFVVSGPWAIPRLRKMVGGTNSVEAANGTIRSDYGGFPIMYNCIHASESPDEAQREWTLFYNSNLDYQEEPQ